MVLPAIDLQDDFIGAVQPGFVIADGGGGDQRAILTDAGDFDERGVERAEKPLPGHRRHLAQMHVKILHLAAVDLFPRDRVGIIGQTKLDAVGPGERAVKLRPGRGTGPDAQSERVAGSVLGLHPRRERLRHGFGITRAGEAAHPNRAAGRDERRGGLRRHDLSVQPGGFNAVRRAHRFPPGCEDFGAGRRRAR